MTVLCGIGRELFSWNVSFPVLKVGKRRRRWVFRLISTLFLSFSLLAPHWGNGRRRHLVIRRMQVNRASRQIFVPTEFDHLQEMRLWLNDNHDFPWDWASRDPFVADTFNNGNSDICQEEDYFIKFIRQYDTIVRRE